MFDLLGVTNIGAHEERLPASSGGQLGGFLSAADRHIGAGFEERLRDPAADPTASARDQDRLAAEVEGVLHVP